MSTWRLPARSVEVPTRPSTIISASVCCARTRTARSMRSWHGGSSGRFVRTRSGSTMPEEPQVVRIANIQHLATAIRAQLAAPVAAVELAGRLHPTPARRRGAGLRCAAPDPRAGGHRSRLVCRAARLDRRQRGRRVLRRAALRVDPGRAGALLRGRRRRRRSDPACRAGRDRDQARRTAAGARRLSAALNSAPLRTRKPSGATGRRPCGRVRLPPAQALTIPAPRRAPRRATPARCSATPIGADGGSG